jgi:hypothetical protein
MGKIILNRILKELYMHLKTKTLPFSEKLHCTKVHVENVLKNYIGAQL